MPDGKKRNSKKAGRAQEKCKRYKDRSQREKNKVRRLLSHINRHPSDEEAMTSVEHLKLFFNNETREKLRNLKHSTKVRLDRLREKRTKAKAKKNKGK